MKLGKLKGIAHDLTIYLDNQIWFGSYKNLQKDIKTDVLSQKNSFDKMCVEFFKERLSKSFEFGRIKNILIEIHRSKSSLNIKIKVKVDGEEFSHAHKSTMNFFRY